MSTRPSEARARDRVTANNRLMGVPTRASIVQLAVQARQFDGASNGQPMLVTAGFLWRGPEQRLAGR